MMVAGVLLVFAFGVVAAGATGMVVALYRGGDATDS
jgi:hypothetical protein